MSAGPDGPKVFVSYRSEDCLFHSSALVDGLSLRLTGWEIFRDLDSLVPGTPWLDRIRSEIAVCTIVLVMIGDNWLDKDVEGDRKIDASHDVLRQEVEAALGRDVPTIPLLVEGARMPTADELPETIRDLAAVHAMQLTEKHWTRDLNELATVMLKAANAKEVAPPEPGVELAIPARITEAWLRKNARALSKSELDELVSVLRRRGWSDGWIIDYLFSEADPDHVPPRRKIKTTGRASAFEPQKRITEAWLARTVPELDGDSLWNLVETMGARGWTNGQIEDYALYHAADEAVEAPTF